MTRSKKKEIEEKEVVNEIKEDSLVEKVDANDNVITPEEEPTEETVVVEADNKDTSVEDNCILSDALRTLRTSVIELLDCRVGSSLHVSTDDKITNSDIVIFGVIEHERDTVISSHIMHHASNRFIVTDNFVGYTGERHCDSKEASFAREGIPFCMNVYDSHYASPDRFSDVRRLAIDTKNVSVYGQNTDIIAMLVNNIFRSVGFSGFDISDRFLPVKVTMIVLSKNNTLAYEANVDIYKNVNSNESTTTTSKVLSSSVYSEYYFEHRDKISNIKHYIASSAIFRKINESMLNFKTEYYKDLNPVCTTSFDSIDELLNTAGTRAIIQGYSRSKTFILDSIDNLNNNIRIVVQNTIRDIVYLYNDATLEESKRVDLSDINNLDDISYPIYQILNTINTVKDHLMYKKVYSDITVDGYKLKKWFGILDTCGEILEEIEHVYTCKDMIIELIHVIENTSAYTTNAEKDSRDKYLRKLGFIFNYLGVKYILIDDMMNLLGGN